MCFTNSEFLQLPSGRNFCLRRKSEVRAEKTAWNHSGRNNCLGYMPIRPGLVFWGDRHIWHTWSVWEKNSVKQHERRKVLLYIPWKKAWPFSSILPSDEDEPIRRFDLPHDDRPTALFVYLGPQTDADDRMQTIACWREAEMPWSSIRAGDGEGMGGRSSCRLETEKDRDLRVRVEQVLR